jgi:hypothetical protein
MKMFDRQVVVVVVVVEVVNQSTLGSDRQEECLGFAYDRRKRRRKRKKDWEEEGQEWLT